MPETMPIIPGNAHKFKLEIRFFFVFQHMPVGNLKNKFTSKIFRKFRCLVLLKHHVFHDIHGLSDDYALTTTGLPVLFLGKEWS